MAITAELHDGTHLEFPDGTAPDVIQATVKRVMSSNQPAAVQAGETLRDIPRQLGLTARAGIKAVAAVPAMMADAVTGVYNTAANAYDDLRSPSPPELVTGKQKGFRFGLSMPALEAALTQAGLPAPANANERVVNDAATMVAGAGGMAAAAGRAAANAAPGVVKNVLSSLAARPGVQMAGAAGAGLAGGSVREAGGSPAEQLAASLAGGIGGGVAAAKTADLARSGANALTRFMTPASVELQRADQAISLTLQRSGIDWSQVPERIKQSMRQEAADAIANGQPMNADALRRLLVFKRTGTTPTVGQLTQDPGMITREKNLAKTGANSTNPGLQALPNLENDNVGTLLGGLDEAGASAAKPASDTGMSAIRSLDDTAGRVQRDIGAKYTAARDTAGRSLPLEGGTFTRRANEMLDQANVGSFLPKDIANKMNGIAAGEIPLTVEIAEQLKTSIGSLQRNSADGNVRTALGIVRKALDEAPLQNGKTWNPGGAPAVPGAVPPSTNAAGQEAIDAFTSARTANREWMRRVEANPALKAVVDGIEPDRFVEKFVIGQGATANDVRKLRAELDPQAVADLRNYIVRHLKDKATGGDQDVTKFGGKSYRGAFRALEDKLPAFFSRDEIQQLRDIGDAAKYMQAQPAGAAVNNSNSGALVLGRGLDMLEQGAQRIPMVGNAITGVLQGAQQRQVMNPRNALIQYAPKGPAPLLVNPLLAGAIVAPEKKR